MRPELLGWYPDLPDARDFRLERLGSVEFPHAFDLRENEFRLFEQRCPQVPCAAALLSMVNWQLKKWLGRNIEGSPRFLYELTAQVWGGGDPVGVSLRNLLKTLKRFGTPPEAVARRDFGPVLERPELFGYAKEYGHFDYLRLDHAWEDFAMRLLSMKAWLLEGNPFLLGFSVPSTVSNTATILPLDFERGGTIGGASCVVMGFDDAIPVANHVSIPDRQSECSLRGAFLVQTCWGSDWGDDGFVWLPYAYVLCRHAMDAWGVMLTDSGSVRS